MEGDSSTPRNQLYTLYVMINIFYKRLLKKIVIKISDILLLNRKSFETKVVNDIFTSKVSLKEEPTFLHKGQTPHSVFQQNFYFPNILFYKLRRQYHTRDIAIILDFNYGRTGNKYNELKSFIKFGLSLKLENIYISSEDSMFSYVNSNFVKHILDITNKKIIIKCKDAVFFHHLIWDLDIKNYSSYEMQAKEIIKTVFITSKVNDLTNKDVVIHLRGGDIFNENNPPEGRHQPPFAWYVTVLLHHEKKIGIDRIIIVFEDNKNPVVNALIKYTKHRNFSFILSSSTIEEDYRYLMGAKVLVPSWGTFCDPAVDLNSDLEYIYKYSDSHVKPNQYINRGEWRANQEQIRLMLDLPLDSINFIA
jgi:hypothetical protein